MSMLKKNFLNILIILVAALLILIVHSIFSKRVEAIENNMHRQLPKAVEVYKNENYSLSINKFYEARIYHAAAVCEPGSHNTNLLLRR